MNTTTIIILGGFFIPLFLYLLSRVHDIEELGNKIMSEIKEVNKWLKEK
jgi:hypothetical protein